MTISFALLKSGKTSDIKVFTTTKDKKDTSDTAKCFKKVIKKIRY